MQSHSTEIGDRDFRNRNELGGWASNLVGKEWKAWWAVTESDRLRLRVEIEALTVLNLSELEFSGGPG